MANLALVVALRRAENDENETSFDEQLEALCRFVVCEQW